MRGAFARRRDGAAGPGAAGGRRAHDGRDGRRVRRGAASRPAAREVVLLTAARERSPGQRGRPIYSAGLSSGSVVARGHSPVVDASRGRNDPRKATLGRLSMARFRCKSCLGGGDLAGRGREVVRSTAGDPLRRRVWGQRPGQPGASPPGAREETTGTMDLMFTGEEWRSPTRSEERPSTSSRVSNAWSQGHAGRARVHRASTIPALGRHRPRGGGAARSPQDVPCPGGGGGRAHGARQASPSGWSARSATTTAARRSVRATKAMH